METVKNILVTGSKGFIGRRLVSELKRSGDFNVYEYDIDKGDISKELLCFEGVHHVFHTAAKTFIPRSWEDPFDFYGTNIMGTLNVLEFCRKQKSRLTYISAYVYGQPERLPIQETHPLKADNPYMHSKIMAESLCEFYSVNYGVKVTVLRPFNVFGPGQGGNFLIPSIIAKLFDKKVKAIEVEDLSPRRDYLYIDDLIEVLALTINMKKDHSVIYNAGSGISMSVEEILNIILKASGIKKPIVSKNRRRKNEVMDVVADISKIKKELGWKPKITFSEGIKIVLEDYRRQKNNAEEKQ